MSYSVVIPTLGRPSLAACLEALADSGATPAEVVLADDRPLSECGPLPVPTAPIPAALRDRIRVVYSCGSGPAAARNAGWRGVSTPWVVFLDDDVVVGPGWAEHLALDLATASTHTAGVQGRITVPLPGGRRPTDWERTTAGLADARWITADIAFRREALADVGGFDERFTRAFREDSDLALRLRAAGWHLTVGGRTTIHPVRPAGPLVSIRAQAGNADDVLMTRLHGRQWWDRAGAPRGRLNRHLLITAAGLSTCAFALAGHPRAAAASGLGWLAGTAEFALARVLPGPRTPREMAAMVATSVAIPPAAVLHHLRGQWRFRAVKRYRHGGPPLGTHAAALPAPDQADEAFA